MTDNDNNSNQSKPDDEGQARREFLKRIGKGSATVPAAVLLLAASTQKAAQAGGGSGCTPASSMPE